MRGALPSSRGRDTGRRRRLCDQPNPTAVCVLQRSRRSPCSLPPSLNQDERKSNQISTELIGSVRLSFAVKLSAKEAWPGWKANPEQVRPSALLSRTPDLAVLAALVSLHDVRDFRSHQALLELRLVGRFE